MMLPFKRLLTHSLIVMAFFSMANAAFANGQEQQEIDTKGATIDQQPEVSLQKPILNDDPSIQVQVSQIDHSEAERLHAVSQRADNVFGLLMSEMAYVNGDVLPSLLSYQILLDRSRAPEVAERAVDIALENNAFDLANRALYVWGQMDPDNVSTSHKQMIWERDLRLGNIENAYEPFNELLKNANEMQVRRMFLQMAQLSLENPSVAKKGVKVIHQAAQQHADISEAAIADILYSALDGNQKNSIKALQRLAKIDSDVRPATQLVLTLIAQKQPQLLVDFFKKTPSSSLSNMWQMLEIETFVHVGNLDKASELLQKQLAMNPNADLLIQAGYLAQQRQEPLEIVEGFYERAYALGGQDQKNRSAIMMSVISFRHKNTDKAILWAERVTASHMQFDKALLLASGFADKGDWAKANVYLQQAKKLDFNSGKIFTKKDYLQLNLMSSMAENNPKRGLSYLDEIIATLNKDSEATVEEIAMAYYQRAIYKSDVLELNESAVADLRHYRKLMPNDPEGMNALGYTLLDVSGGLKEGMQLIQKAYLLLPDTPHVLDSLGWAYYKQGDLEKALEYLQQAYEMMTPNADIAAHLGEVLWQLGKIDEAKAVWQEGLSDNEKSVFQAKQKQDSLLLKTMKRFGVQVTIPAIENAQ